MNLQTCTDIVITLAFFLPPVLYFVLDFKPKPRKKISVIKEESNEIPEDEVDYFFVDSDPYND